MIHFSKPIQIQWADIDANRHLRHSVYYDYGATMRMNVLSEGGLTTQKLEEFSIGPILFREEAIFKREILLEDVLTLTVELVKASEDYSRWSLRHQFLKNGDIVAALLNVDGAWIDLNKRKLAIPDPFIRSIFDQFPKSNDFELIPLKSK
jgi:acyl-CoA thioester hydrolase